MAEILVSVAVFGLVVASVSAALVTLARHQKSAGLKERAVFLAEEGIEAVRNIRDAGFSNLTDGTYGLVQSGGQWTFSGSQDTVGQFTRQTVISTVNADQKQIVVNVTWPQGALSRNVSVANYLTNWQLATAAASGGLLIYGDTTIAPKYRNYDTAANTFSSENITASSSIGQSFIIRASPTKTEAIAGFVTSAGNLNIFCYDGSNWSQEWSLNVGGNSSTRRFDIAYETTTGDAMVLYSTNTATTNELAYRTKPGSSGCGAGSWASAANLNPVRTSGIVHWVKMAWDKRGGQNLITAIWADANSDLSAMVWSGSAWGNEPAAVTEASLEIIATPQDVEDFDVEYESLSGDVMVVWANSAGSNGTNGVRYRTCTGGTSACTWNAVTTPPTFSDDATNLDLAANPNTDQMVFASIGNAGRDLQLGYWSGSAWTNTANADTSCNIPAAGTKMVAAGWLVSGGTTRSVVRYADQGSTAIDWYTGNLGVFSKQKDFVPSPAVSNPNYFEMQMDPQNKDQLMLVTSGGANQLIAKRLVMTAAPVFTWTNADGAVLEATLPQTINSPFAFTFWR